MASCGTQSLSSSESEELKEYLSLFITDIQILQILMERCAKPIKLVSNKSPKSKSRNASQFNSRVSSIYEANQQSKDQVLKKEASLFKFEGIYRRNELAESQVREYPPPIFEDPIKGFTDSGASFSLSSIRVARPFKGRYSFGDSSFIGEDESSKLRKFSNEGILSGVFPINDARSTASQHFYSSKRATQIVELCDKCDQLYLVSQCYLHRKATCGKVYNKTQCLERWSRLITILNYIRTSERNDQIEHLIVEMEKYQKMATQTNFSAVWHSKELDRLLRMAMNTSSELVSKNNLIYVIQILGERIEQGYEEQDSLLADCCNGCFLFDDEPAKSSMFFASSRK